ncbi:MAG: DUF427 domain-containing protein [Pseudomonadota bacterium]
MRTLTKDELLRRVAPARVKWGPRPCDVALEPVGPGEESVWDYPRPPVIEHATLPVRVVFADQTIASSTRAVRVLETAGAPAYYIPPDDVRMDLLRQREEASICEWKGIAVYYDLCLDGEIAARAAFSYPDPLDDLPEGYAALAGWVGFYPGRVQACYVGDERVEPQEGGLYAGWVTKNIKGPIKGKPGTGHW